MRRFRPAILLLLAGIIIVLVFFGAQLQVPTVFARPSYTSSSLTAPATNTCAGCHGSTANPGGSAVVTGFPSTMTYTPGGTPLHLSVKVTDPVHTTFSYLLTARLVNTLSSQAGTYTLTDANSTTSGLDIEAASFAVSTWSFDWTPPATNVGSVTFYLTGVATTGDTSVSSGVYQSAVTLAPAAPPDFSLSALPSSLTVIQGASGTSTVTVAPLNGFTGSVALAASGMPSGVTATFSPTSTTGTSTLTLAASSAATTGTSTVTITGTSGTLSHTTTVSLTVNAPVAPTLTATPSSLSFAAQQGGAAPASQNISVGSSVSGLTYTTTSSGGSTWLTATPAVGNAPGTVSVSVNPTGLAAGTYTGTVTITSSGATGSPKTISINLVVSAATGNSLITVTPGSLQFDYQNGGSIPPPQMLTITSTGSPLLYTDSSSDVSWLTASPTSGTTPATIMVAVNPVGMSAGSYSGLIQVIASGTAGSIVPVTLNVTQNLSNTTTSSSSYPAITVDANNNINIVWQDGTSGILFSRSVNGGTTFSTPKPIPGSVGASFQPQMIVDGSGSIDIVWTGAGATEVLFSRSTDGVNFSATPKIVAQNLGGVLNSAPRIDLDANGGTDVVWGRTDEYFSRSTDAGTTFSTPVKLSTAVGNISASRIVASSTGNLYVVWTDEQNRTPNGNCNEFFSRSLDKGVTFSAPAAIYSVGCSHDNMQTAVDPSGTLLLFWSDDIPFEDVLFSRSLDFGSTFMSPINLAQSAATSLQGAIENKSGNIDVVWAGDPNAAEGIFFSRSLDGGVSFASQKLLSVPGPAGTLPPASPQILVDANDNINVIWQQGTAGTNTFDVFFSRSTDGGATFQTIKKISATSSLQCPPAIPCGNARFALDAVGDSNVVWVDHAATAQNSNIDFSRVVLSQPVSDFGISISAASQRVVPGGTVSYTVALTATGAFNQAVTLSCSGLPTGVTCAAPTPAAITPPGSATVNVTVANTIAPGTYSFTVNGANGATTHNQSVQLQVVPESLTLSASSGSASIAAGSSANFTMTAASISGVTGTVTLSCTGAPSGVGCNFAPVQVTVPANGNATTTLTVHVTSKPSLGSFHKFPKGPLPLQRIMVWWIIAALLLMSTRMVASSRREYATPPFLARRVAIMLLTIILSGGLISCAGLTTKTNTNAPPVSFTLTIQAQNQSGSVKASIPIQITVP